MSKTCNGCGTSEMQGVPLVVYEKEMTRYERVIKKLWILIILLIVLLVGTNISWLIYNSQFETVETTTIEAEQNGDGTNVVGGGDIIYGAESQDYNNKEKSS